MVAISGKLNALSCLIDWMSDAHRLFETQVPKSKWYDKVANLSVIHFTTIGKKKHGR
jgi:hypothetical protein